MTSSAHILPSFTNSERTFLWREKICLNTCAKIALKPSSGPHLVAAAFKNVASIAVAVDYKMKQIEEIQAILSDPEALKKAQEAAAAASTAPTEAAEEKKEEEEVVELAGGFDDLFG